MADPILPPPPTDAELQEFAQIQEAKMIKFYRDFAEVSLEQVTSEMLASAKDAGAHEEMALAIVAGALAGDACDQEAIEDFTGCICAT